MIKDKLFCAHFRAQPSPVTRIPIARGLPYPSRHTITDTSMLATTSQHAKDRATRVSHVIAFGFLATFMSSFGQTFFVGLFSTQFGAATDIDGTTVSLLYGIATLASGSLLFWLGGVMDRLTLRLAITVSLTVLIFGCLLIAGMHTGAMLLAAFFLLRLGGQGLLTQLAVVAAARNGGARRGTMIAWASMGVILGEAILPAAVISTLGLFHWRYLWLAVAVLLLIIVIPTMLRLQRHIYWRETTNRPTSHDSRPEMTPLRRRVLLTDRRFWAGAAIMLTPPFMTTGFLFEQRSFAHAMHWDMALIGAAFAVFAVLRAFGTWFYGRAADRFGAVLMTRIHLLPMALAFASLALPLGRASIWVAFAGLGLTSGANSVLSGAVWADLFGTAAVGTVRGVFGAAMVLASALAPVTVAMAMAIGLSAPELGVVFGIYALIVPMLASPFLPYRCAR
jgi:MFS family permease